MMDSLRSRSLEHTLEHDIMIIMIMIITKGQLRTLCCKFLGGSLSEMLWLS